LSTPILQSPRQPSIAEPAYIFRMAEAFRRVTSDHLRANFSDQPKQKSRGTAGFSFDATRITGSFIICSIGEAFLLGKAIEGARAG
jgi:hypothetical protein